MPDFWQTGQTVEELFGKDFESWPLFGMTHILELLVCIGICILMMQIFRKADAEHRRKIMVVLTVLLLLDEAAKHLETVLTGQWNVGYLPLHICSINLFVCAFNTYRPGRILKEILYAICLPGAAVALLMPNWNILPVWNFMQIHSYTVHVMLALYPLLMLLDGFRPDIRNIPKLAVMLTAACVPIAWINSVLGTNFFFISDPGTNALTQWFASVLGERFYPVGFLLVLFAVWVLMYLPWYYSERKKS